MSDHGWHPIPVMIIGVAGTSILATTWTPLMGAPYWWVPAVGGTFLAFFVGLVGGLMALDGRITRGRARHTTVTLFAAFAFTSWIAKFGWTKPAGFVLGVGALVLCALAYAIGEPDPKAFVEEEPERDRRPEAIVSWEAILTRITGAKPGQIVVDDVVPWDNPDEGEKVFGHFDESGEKTIDDLDSDKIRTRIATARRLPQGCTIEIQDGDHQGAFALDVMRRNTLDESRTLVMPTTPARITDPVTVIHTTRGEPVDVVLRRDTLVVGGATDSGKTTLLDAILMHAERCPDCLPWVFDPNGGGLARRHVQAYARGESPVPGVDWVAPDTMEGIAMTKLAYLIAHDRKTSPECGERKDAVRTTLLPVDHLVPELLIVTDELGALMKGSGFEAVANNTVNDNLQAIVEEGRAEAVRVVLSYLRGTSDIANRSAKVQAALRICLRMNEDVEYPHILGMSPPRVRLTEIGQGYILRRQDPRPILGRTSIVEYDDVVAHTIATAHLRPQLDEEARELAASLRLRDIFPDKLITDELRDSLLGQHIEDGLLYEGRWERAQPMLDRIAGRRGTRARPTVATKPAGDSYSDFMDLAEKITGQRFDDDAPAPTRTQAPVAAPPRSDDEVFAELTSSDHFVGRTAPDPTPRSATQERVGDQEPVEKADTARGQLLAALDQAYPEGLTGEQLQAVVTCSKQRRAKLLEILEAQGAVRRDGALWYAVR